MEKVLLLASVSSMIDQFNMPNIRILQNLGYQVDVACNFIEGNTSSSSRVEMFMKELEDMNVNCVQIDFSRSITNISSNLKAYRQVKDLLKSNRYKFIHCHSPIGGVIGRIVARQTRTKVIYTAHGFHFFKGAPILNWMLYYPIEKVLSYFTDVLITINNEDYQFAKNSMNAKETLYTPGVGVDTNQFNRKVDKLVERESLGLSKDAILICSVGELNKNKNHEVIIRALHKVNKKNIEYVICGRGNLESDLKNLTESLGLSDQVHFLGFRSDVSRILQAVDLYAFPSYREGLSVSLIEAMASELPIVCSKIRGNTDLVEEGKNGFLSLPNDVDSFARSISILCSDEELRRNFGASSKLKSNKNDIENVSKLMKNIYSTIK